VDAFFDNGREGTMRLAMQVLGSKTKMPKRSGCFRARQHGHKCPKTRREIWCYDWEVYNAQEKRFERCLLRTMWTWRFVERRSFPFESTEAYQKKRIEERFSGAMLEGYLRHWGIAAYEKSFYAPTSRRHRSY